MTNKHIATVQAAILHEALSRAARIAPTKGSAFDRAAGIQIHFGPDEAHVKATDLDVTFYQRIPVREVTEERTIRVSTVIPSFVASLSMDKDQEIRFHEDDKGRIVVQYAKTRTKATVPQITGEYPSIRWHDYDEMTDASDLSNKIASVAWAVEPDAHGVLAGVRIDGDWLEGLSSKNAARIRCEVEAGEPVIAVLKTIVPLMKTGSRVKLKVLDGGHIVVALDETAQLTSTTVLGEWPNLVERLEKLEFPNTFMLRKNRLEEALKRVLSFVRNDRLPKVTMTITTDSVDVALGGTMNGDVQDSCALISRTGDEVVEFTFNPNWLLEAVETFPGATLQVDFNGQFQPIRLSEPSTSYEAYVMPMRNSE